MSKRILCLQITAIIISAFIVYANSLDGKFVWDDYVYVKDNTHIKNWSYITNIFTENIGKGYAEMTGISTFYRPMQMLTYMIDYSLWGLNVFGYHLTNILLHILVGLCLYWLVVKIFENQPLALIATLLYIVHPVHVEAIASIAGRADPLSALFILFSLIFYIKTFPSLNISFCILTLLSFIFALLSKESVAIFPLVLLIYHYTFKKKINLNLFLSVLGVLFLYFLIRLVFLDSLPFKTLNIASMFQRIPGFFVALVNYLRLLLLPTNLHVHYGDLMFSFTDKKTILGILIFCFLLWCAFKNKKKDKLLFFSVLWCFIFLLPVSNIYRINDSFMKEHWLYLASVGFFLIMARWLIELYKNKSTKIIGLFCIIGAFIFYSLCTIKQNNYWHDPIAFLKKSLYYSPDYPIFYNELGREYENLGKFEEAASYYKKALEINQNLIGIYYNLGITYEKAGKYREAIIAYQQALDRNSEDVNVSYIIARLYNKINDKEKSIMMYNRAKELSSKFSQKYLELANNYKEVGKEKEAITSYEKALEFAPKNLFIYDELANLYISAGEFKKAIKVLKKSLEINPNIGVTHNNLAVAYYYERQYDLAIKYYNNAIELGYKVTPKFLQLLKPYRK